MSLFESSIEKIAEHVNTALDELLPKPEGPSARLVEAMRYSVLNGGKRFRAFLVIRACELSGGKREQAVHTACAIECLHAYSLIHDDLPAMDDDDLRRGKPSCHKKFDEATAILAGDALLTLAFELVASAPIPGDRIARNVRILAERAGHKGMVGGQMSDMLGENEPPNPALMLTIHEHKTADLIAASVMMGANCGGAPSKLLEQWQDFGHNCGMAFQVSDDVCDSTSTAEEMGKAIGKDKSAGKQTAVAVLGLAGAQSLAGGYSARALKALTFLGARAHDLRDLARWLPKRRS
jgi:farnesyl diphosphate synthase